MFGSYRNSRRKFVNTVNLHRAYSYTSVSPTVTRWRGWGVRFFIDEAVLEADPPRTIESSVGFVESSPSLLLGPAPGITRPHVGGHTRAHRCTERAHSTLHHIRGTARLVASVRDLERAPAQRRRINLRPIRPCLPHGGPLEHALVTNTAKPSV